MAPRVARAVWPNAGVEAWYRSQLDAIISEFSADMERRLREAWEENPPSIGILAKDIALRLAHKALGLAAPLLAMDAASSTLIQRALERWGGLWTKKLDALSLSLAAKFADRNFSATQAAMKKSFEDAGLAVKFKPTRKSLDAYKAVIAENVGLIKSIPEQYLAGVQGQVWAAVRKGGDLHTLSVDLRKRHGITVRRAALIARDQNNKAKAVIENVRRQEIGVTAAIWRHSTAGKEPRPTHVAATGTRYKLSEGFYDTDEGKFVFPGELINCRCVSKAIIPGFE